MFALTLFTNIGGSPLVTNINILSDKIMFFLIGFISEIYIRMQCTAIVFAITKKVADMSWILLPHIDKPVYKIF